VSQKEAKREREKSLKLNKGKERRDIGLRASKKRKD